MHRIFVIFILSFSFGIVANVAAAQNCRIVEDEHFIQINSDSMKVFEEAGLNREIVFKRLVSIARTETGGCWGQVSQNFDGQLISAGAFQWNYGQNSIQPLLRDFIGKLHTSSLLRQQFAELMPAFGQLVFSNRCLRDTPNGGGSAEPHPCREDFLDPNDPERLRLKPELMREMKALFETDAMIQIQMDKVVAQMDRAIDYTRRFFDVYTVSERQFHWTLDMLVQQGGFNRLEYLKANTQRAIEAGLLGGNENKATALRGILLWYAGLVFSPDQDGIKCDWRYNIEKWSELIRTNQVSDEQFYLIAASWVRARIAKGEAGRWQALAFQRRAKIAFGEGSVGWESVGRDNHYECRKPSPEDYDILAEITQ